MPERRLNALLSEMTVLFRAAILNMALGLLRPFDRPQKLDSKQRCCDATGGCL